MRTHFYLRDKEKRPVACVAVHLSDTIRGTQGAFAVSSYNPEDAKLGIPWNKQKAKLMAYGRLDSGRPGRSHKFKSDQTLSGLEIKRLICKLIVGDWSKSHPYAHATLAGAWNWLNHDLNRPPSQPPPPTKRAA